MPSSSSNEGEVTNLNPPAAIVQNRTVTQLVAGALAGAVGKTIIAPLDRTKIIFQTSHSRAFSWRAVGEELRRITREEGPRKLWRGHSATLARVVRLDISFLFIVIAKFLSYPTVVVNVYVLFRRALPIVVVNVYVLSRPLY
jgi:hypothetical protein